MEEKKISKPKEILILEKKLGYELNKVDIAEIGNWGEGYSTNENNDIIGLDLSVSEITDISDLLKFEKLKVLNLSNGFLNSITGISILKEIEELNLSGSLLNDISDLNNLKKLKRLKLGRSKLKSISSLSTLKELKYLDLSYSEVIDFASISKLAQLEELKLSGLKIHEISFLSSLKNLIKLNLDATEIAEIGAISYLNELTDLNLRNTKIYDGSPLSNLHSLKNLDLSKTKISNIKFLNKLKVLSNLNIHSTAITDFSELNDLINLEILNLSGTRFNNTTILSNKYKLTNLNLYNTSVEDISFLSSLSELRTLNISRTNVRDISPLSGLVRLKQLNISDTQVSKIDPLENLINLERLLISNTKVSSLKPISSLSNIKSLHLTRTEITNLSPLSNLKEIRHLFLRHTKISDISILRTLTKLRLCYFSNSLVEDIEQVNDLITCCPDLALIRMENTLLPLDSSLLSDVEGLRAYFKDAHHGVTQKRNTKLLFLGDGCVGKSTLLEHLKTLKVPNEIPIDDRTEGVELDIWRDVLPNMKVNVWDFGGQEVMHSTHRLFLGERAVYILVWCKESQKLCSGRETHNLQYWLDFIADYGRHSIVLLVENVINNEFDNKEFPDDEELVHLVKKYRERNIELIATQYRFDVKNDTDEVESFRDTIKNKIKSLHKKFPIQSYPESWYIFQEQLEHEKETHKTIPLNRYIQLGIKCQVSNTKALLSFFDKTGVIGYYKNLANNTVILQMDWILDAVYITVRLKDNPLRRTGGKLTDDDFEKVWRDYSTKERILFKEYMLKSNLLSRPTDDSENRNYQYLCPSLFEEKSIDTIQWHDKEEYLVVKFNFMFGAIMQQLQVRALNHCNHEEREVFYKNYMSFKDKENQQVWIEMLPNEKELRIFSNHQNSIQIVLNELNEIYPLTRTELILREKSGNEAEYVFEENSDELFDSRNDFEKVEILTMEEEVREEKPIKVFVTYSWTDAPGKDHEKHRNRVGDLFAQLRSRWGMNAIIDIITEENNFTQMMYENIFTSDRVIIVLSEGYAKKADEFGNTGVATEYKRVINDQNHNPKKYILVSFDDRNPKKIPFGFKGDNVIVLKGDLQKDNLPENQNELFGRLLDKPTVEIPEVSKTRPKLRTKKFNS